MKPLLFSAIALACTLAANAQTTDASPDALAAPDSGTAISGKLRVQWDDRHPNAASPLAQANAVQSGTVVPNTSGATAELELRASGKGWNGTATVQEQTHQGQASTHRAWLNEGVFSVDAASWQYSAGKKIVAWDVGYGFRPNDVVQQEERRTLIASTAEGRPVLMAERYSAETAWSLVWVNPTKPHAQRGAQEPALAARVYQRDGSVDWHGFVRAGAHTGASVGAAVAWVASDATELHASVRHLRRFDTVAMADDVGTGALSRTDPWLDVRAGATTQALVGATWTHESQFSVLAEAWWDGTALANSQWQAWRARNALLPALRALGAPASAVAGNLAWQGDAYGASSNLQRSNLYLRLSWENEGWQPSLDVLYHPADGGRMLTVALLYKGDRMQVQGGVRTNAGPANSALAQLPTRRQGYLATSWAF